MTKSPRSVTKKLQLASLFRWLAILCFIKLAIFTMILLDAPFPAFDKPAKNVSVKTQLQPQIKVHLNAEPQAPAPVDQALPKDSNRTLLSEAPLPQGVEAAKLAQSIKPKARPSSVLAEKKQDEVVADLETEQALVGKSNLHLPKPLPAPIAKAGDPIPNQRMVAENTLPVPTLGSVTAAQAAASMPVPETGPSESTFAPVEQQAPLDIPGAPDIPKDLPRGSSANQLKPLTNMPRPDLQQPQPKSAIEMTTEAQEIARQQQDMLVLKKQMDERLKELQDSEAKMQRMLDEAHGLEEKKLKALILMYANMKPKTAAKALEKMDSRTACKILRGMTAKQSGDILSYTNPAVTAKLTELLTRMKTY
ncbi:MAG: hypothetical protein IJT59_00140 [Desulfovibrionaceae bacterium]|nr:hypothetical protein [Desulfovibrionaceae bacterium]